MPTKKSIQVGDIFEIVTPRGLAYIQYTHDGKDFGDLVRILPGLFEVRPNLEELNRQKEMYFTFYLLRECIGRGKAIRVASLAVPEWVRPYPPMRFDRNFDNAVPRVHWLIGDASERLTLETIPKMKSVTGLSAEQKKLSIHALWPHPWLVQRLAEEWTPERDDEFILKARAEAKQENTESSDGVLDHFLYFDNKKKGNSAAAHLRGMGWVVEVKRSADGQQWLVRGYQPQPVEHIESVRQELEDLADKLGGEYDGWGIPV